MNKRITGAIMSIGLALATSSVLANSSNLQAENGCAKHRGWSHEEKSTFSMPSERIEARLAYIKTALKITDAQNPQWETFADMERKQAQESDKRVQEWQAKREHYDESRCGTGAAGERESHLSAIDRMERKEKHLNDSVKRLDAKITALRSLYAVLSEEQKRVADEVLADHHHRGWSHGKFEHADIQERLLIDLHRLVQI